MISHEHETVFVHIPKCGGQSIEHMFLDDLGLSWETRSPLLLRPKDPGEKGPPRLAHLLARDYVGLEYISEEQFSRYYKFAVVRNPYGRALSFYNYLRIGPARSALLQAVLGPRVARRLTGIRKIGLDEFFLDWLPKQFLDGDSDGSASKFWFVRPQADYVFDGAGALLVDRLVRLENLGQEIDEVRTQCRLRAELRHVNRSSVAAAQNELMPRHLDSIEELYRDDFEAFGYARRPR